MTDLQEWERQLQDQLADIRRESRQLADAVAGVRGRGEVRGVTVEVDTTGEITTLLIAPAAMQWSSTQLTSTILDCHRRARASAIQQVEKLVQSADPRIRTPLEELRRTSESTPTPRQPMTEDEIQAADDEYFLRRNQHDWSS